MSSPAYFFSILPEQGGNVQTAREQIEQAGAQFQVSGLNDELEQMRRQSHGSR